MLFRDGAAMKRHDGAAVSLRFHEVANPLNAFHSFAAAPILHGLMSADVKRPDNRVLIRGLNGGR